MARGKIRAIRKILIEKEQYFEAILEYSRKEDLDIYYDYRTIKDRKSQKRLLPEHLRIKRIPKYIELKLW
ncbi:MAG: hypothetical protein GF329_00400 [Candidatus Lokiarchaeota archaeon]|nr:hypothetical protein [Candidatus Lokiarchaeota archaeon]